jgi:hypothetical protein
MVRLFATSWERPKAGTEIILLGDRSLCDQQRLGNPFESVIEQTWVAVEIDPLPPGMTPKACRGNVFDDDVDRYLGTCRYQSTIDFLSLIWCDPS